MSSREENIIQVQFETLTMEVKTTVPAEEKCLFQFEINLIRVNFRLFFTPLEIKPYMFCVFKKILRIDLGH